MELTRRQIRAVDRIAIDQLGLPGVVLMENAGRGAVDVMRREANPRRVLIACGKGNNAGDGYVMARHLECLGAEVRIVTAWPTTLTGDAAVHQQVWRAAGGREAPWQCAAAMGQVAELTDWQPDWVVDALLGTGASGPLRPPLPELLAALNNLPGRKLAVDVPTGLDCDTGAVDPSAFRADVTCTFVATKPGFHAAAAASQLGEVVVVGIGVPHMVVEQALRTE